MTKAPKTDPKKRERPTKPEWVAIGQRIRRAMSHRPELRKQNDLAAATGINIGSLSYILNGKQEAGIENLTKIAKALGITVAELMPDAPTITLANQGSEFDDDSDPVGQAMLSYVERNKSILTETEIGWLTKGGFWNEIDAIPDDKAISDFLRAKRALLERLNSGSSGSRGNGGPGQG